MDIPLDAFLSKASIQEKKDKKASQDSASKKATSSKEGTKLRESFTSIPKDKEQVHLIGVQYDGKLQKALMQFYNDRTASIVEIPDPYNHHSYCLSELPPERIMEFKAIKTNERVFKPIQTIERFDLISERKRTFSKIEATDPLAIGGTRNSVREILPRAWEAKIRYHLNYIYDFQLIPSMPYRLTNGEIERPALETDREMQEKICAALKGEIEKRKELSAVLNEYLPLFVTPVPNIKRAAIDIEITSPSADTLPDPNQAEQPIISVALVGSDDEQYVFLLRRKGIQEGIRSEILLKGVHCAFFEEEKEDALLRLLFAKMREYPVLLTFNGDRFDFLYLYNRAKRLGFQEKDIPLSLGRNQVYVEKGIHIDLYRFFFNASIRIYAFSTKYKNVSLDAVSHALLGVGKIELDVLPYELDLYDLVAYNLRDAELTMNLTTFDNNLAWNLMMLLSRIVKLPLEDLTRTGVSKWIENLFYYEHRKRNYLIPLPEEVRREGEAVTKAIIKGKKYKGALVVPPKAGIHFKTVVLDFACFSEDTEILTDNGWYTLAKLKKKNCFPKIATVNTSSGEVEFQDCQKIFEYNYTGEMYNFKINGALDLLVTPNHRMVYNRRTNERQKTEWRNEIEIAEAQELSKRSWFRIPHFGKWTGKSGNIVIGDHIFSPEAFLPFLGWFLTDGSFAERSVCIHQSKAKNFQHIRDTLACLDFPFKEYEYNKHGKYHRVFQINDVKFKRQFKKWLIEEKGLIEENDSYLKRIPRKILGFEKRHLKLLFDSMLLGDGSWMNGKCYSLSSIYKERINDFQELALRLGYGSSITKEIHDCTIFDDEYKDHVSYRCFLSYTRKNAFNNQHDKIQKKNYSGNVWCVSVLNGTVIVRRNGKPAITGNSLYPSIIKVTNLSYETINCSHTECQTNLIPDTPHWVCTKKSGLTALLVGFLRDIRVLWFKQEAKNPKTPSARRNLYQVVEKALKVLINASYGAFGAAHFALYCPAVAESTTAVGRDAIMQTIDKAQEIGVEILYGDTDSVFIKDPSPKQIEQLIQWSIDVLKIPLDVDKVYRYVALSDRKKNYLGVFDDGSVDIKGLIAKKRNTPQFVKEAFARVTQILSVVQTEAEFFDAKEQIREVVKESYRKLEKGELSLEDLAFRVQLSKPLSKYHKTTPQHAKAGNLLAIRRIKHLRDRGVPLPDNEKAARDTVVPPGTIVSYVKTSGGEGVLPVEGSHRNEVSIDVGRYKDYVETTFTQILDAMGIPFSEMQRIVSLDSFF